MEQSVREQEERKSEQQACSRYGQEPLLTYPLEL